MNVLFQEKKITNIIYIIIIANSQNLLLFEFFNDSFAERLITSWFTIRFSAIIFKIFTSINFKT